MINSDSIRKEIRSQSTGNENSVAQAFSQNYFQKINPVRTTVFNFETPVYSIEQASYDYYSQNRDALSFNLNNGKQYVMVFSGNTSSLSGITTVNHELHRIKYEDYVAASLNSNSSAYTENIINSLISPMVIFTENASGSTGVYANLVGNRYTFTFPIQVKPTGTYTLDLFYDKAQYFINTKFAFPKPVDITVGQIQTYSGSSAESIVTIQEYPTSTYEWLSSSLGSKIISGDTPFSGLTAPGAFFTYFVPPQKPNLNVGGGNSTNPVRGNLTTFSPTWNFANVDDGDFYKLQITYDITDYTFSSSNVATFPINKQANYGDAEFVVTFSKPLTPNVDFLYRIGNTKEIINIFGVKQSLTTWTDYISARTANDGRFNLSGTTYKNYVWDGDYDFVLSGMTGGTMISGVTLELSSLYTNSSIDIFVDSKADSSIFTPINVNLSDGSTNTGGGNVVSTVVSDAYGHFDFGRIDGGVYTLRVIPPAQYIDYFNVQVITINIGADTDLTIILSILWGNTVLDFMTPETFL